MWSWTVLKLNVFFFFLNCTRWMVSFVLEKGGSLIFCCQFISWHFQTLAIYHWGISPSIIQLNSKHRDMMNTYYPSIKYILASYYVLNSKGHKRYVCQITDDRKLKYMKVLKDNSFFLFPSWGEIILFCPIEVRPCLVTLASEIYWKLSCVNFRQKL